MVESLGWLTIIGFGIFLVVLYLTNEDKKKWEREKLIKYSDKCQKVIREHNNTILKGQPSTTNFELDKKIKQLLDDPEERQKAINKLALEKEYEQKKQQELREQRKVGYKYEIEIFEIFDTSYELKLPVLLEKIKEKFKAHDDEARQILTIWEDNFLVTPGRNNNLRTIGNILMYDFYGLDKTDLTWEKWLNQQGKTRPK